MLAVQSIYAPITRINEMPQVPFKVSGQVIGETKREIVRKDTWSANYKPNFKVGESTEVFAMKRAEDVVALQRYFIDREQYRNALYVVMSVNMGLRGSDMCRLRWCDVLDNDGRFKTPENAYMIEQKTGKKRPLIFNKDVRDAITMYLHKTGIVPQLANEQHPHYWVFPKANGVRSYKGKQTEIHMSRRGMGHILKTAAKEVGIKYNVNTHTLRKTFGYRLYKANVPIEVIQRIFNHSTTLITSRYIGLTLDVEVNYLDDLESILIRMDEDDRDI